MKRLIRLLLIVFLPVSHAGPMEKKIDPWAKLQSIVETHYQTYAEREHFSAIQAAVMAEGKIHNIVHGRRALDAAAEPITKEDLFEIGSISKSYTAALSLLAEAEKKLDLGHVVGDYLQQYPNWSDIRVEQLLNMSSGLPNYSDAPKLNYLWSKNLKQFWNNVELLALVYSQALNPPRKTGYFYTNTGYVLMDMILSSSYKKTFRQLLREKIIEPLGLNNSFYPLPTYPREVFTRMVRGYSYNVYSNPELLGQDVTENNLSWAGAAGGIVANAEDVVHWVYHLFISDKLLSSEQKKKMQTLISVKSGEPIQKLTKDDPRGFGLGIIKAYRPEIGDFWFYEGETLGYRAFYMYKPCNQVIISLLFNSATNSQNDQGGQLMMNLYQQLLKNNPQLVCEQPKEAQVEAAYHFDINYQSPT